MGGLLTYFSFVAATMNFMEMQQQLLAQSPEAKRLFDEALKKVDKK